MGCQRIVVCQRFWHKKAERLFYQNRRSAMVEEGGFEPPKSVTADLQSAPFGRSGTLPYSFLPIVRKWSWWTDSNPRPADYKSAALPTELHQHRYSLSGCLNTIAQFFVFVKSFFEFFLHHPRQTRLLLSASRIRSLPATWFSRYAGCRGRSEA